MNKELLKVIAACVVSVIAGIVLYRYTLYEPQFVSAPPVTPAQKVAQTITFNDIVLSDLDQQPQALSQWKKPIMVVNFWAPWCAPCRREIPALIEVQNDYTDQVQLVGLSFDSLQNVRDFEPNFDFNYPLLLVDELSSALNQFFGNVSGGLPFTVVLNAQREIVYSHAGEMDKAMLEAQIKPLL